MNHAALTATFQPFSWHAFWWLFRESLDFLFVGPMWAVTLALVANLGAALMRTWHFRHDRWKKEYWLVFVSLSFIPVTIAIGVVGWIDPNLMPRPKPNMLAIWANNGLFIASLLFGIYWIYRMKGLRWLALAAMLIQLWLLFGAGFLAGMALSGDWL
jgi:hypothetical protein